MLQCYVTELLKNGNLRTSEGLSANSVNSIITVIQNTLKTAYSLEIVSEYVGDKIKRPRTSEKKIECFSLSEQKKIDQAFEKASHYSIYRVFQQAKENDWIEM